MTTSNRIFLIAILQSVILFNLNGQSTSGHIGLTIGPSFPIGDYSNKDGGNAITGYFFEFDGSYPINESKFALKASLRFQGNPTNLDANLDNLLSNPGILVAEIEEQSGWSLGTLLIGGCLNEEITDGVFLEPKLLIGLGGAVSPSYEFDVVGVSGRASSRIDEDNATTFVYLIGVDMKYDLSERLYLLGKLDYLGTTAKFDEIEIEINGFDFINEAKQSYSTINLGVGIALKL